MYKPKEGEPMYLYCKMMYQYLSIYICTYIYCLNVFDIKRILSSIVYNRNK